MEELHEAMQIIYTEGFLTMNKELEKALSLLQIVDEKISNDEERKPNPIRRGEQHEHTIQTER